MTVIDVVIIIVIIVSAAFGALRGLIKESISLAKWILGILIAKSFYSNLAQMLPIDSPAASQVTAFAMLFITVFIIGTLISYTMTEVVKKTGLTSADRVLGFGFGFLRGLLIIVIFVIIARMVSLDTMEWWQTSRLLERFENAADILRDYLPGDMPSAIERQVGT